MPRWNSCIAESCIAEIMHRESIIMHDEKISCLVKIYTSREEFMPRWNSCIAKIMHRANHASRVINYARREDFMPRQNLCTTRRIHASSKFAHRKKILFFAESYASREDSYLAGIYVSREDIHDPQEDVLG